jgi:hypothetical protein
LPHWAGSTSPSQVTTSGQLSNLKRDSEATTGRSLLVPAASNLTYDFEQIVR